MKMVKSDYAANAGTGTDIGGTQSVPNSTSVMDSFTDWKIVLTDLDGLTGVVLFHDTITPAQITDGTSNTYCVGEKFLDPQYYEGDDSSVTDFGDNETAFCGYDRDICRSSYYIPHCDKHGAEEYDFGEATNGFGSAHPGGCNMAFCDGSVRTISYEIDEFTNQCLGNRSDGAALDSTKY